MLYRSRPRWRLGHACQPARQRQTALVNFSEPAAAPETCCCRLATPSAVLLSDDGKIARPTAVGPDAIRHLVSDVTAVRVRRGDPAPGLTLLDLHGDAVDLGQPRSGQTLLVFWNPSWGFCQQMLDALRAWELHPTSDRPDMLVISTGSVEANLKQGFRSRVLLDDDFKAGQVLGVTGTPSAILLDERNRVASEVAVGKDPVLALANGSKLKRWR